MHQFQLNADSSTKPVPVFDQTPSSTSADLTVSASSSPDSPFQLSATIRLFCATPGATIRYSFGEAVDESSSTFDSTNPILLTQTTTIHAQAFQNGQSGPEFEATFEIKRAVWQELEPLDRSDEAPHKIGENQISPDDWNTAAASVRGKLHAHRALWREDSFALGFVETPGGVWNIHVVSDGAGSAPLSRVGSRVACESALETLAGALGFVDELSTGEDELVTRDLPRLRAALVEAATAALDALKSEAQARNRPLSAFAATLLILVRRAWNDGQLCGALQVGDGAIALCCDELKLLGEADHGQHSSETRFLTTLGIGTEWASRIKFSFPRDLRATLVVSDGVSDDFFPENPRLDDVFTAVLPLVKNAPNAANAAVAWLGYEKKGSSDDRTLVVSWPASPPNAPAMRAREPDTPLAANALLVDEAASSQNEPASSTNELASSTNELASSTNELASSTNELASPQNELASSTNEPASSTKEPASSTLLPVSSLRHPEGALATEGSGVSKTSSSQQREILQSLRLPQDDGEVADATPPESASSMSESASSMNESASSMSESASSMSESASSTSESASSTSESASSTSSQSLLDEFAASIQNASTKPTRKLEPDYGD